VKFIDPNGKNIYSIDEKGNIALRMENKDSRDELVGGDKDHITDIYVEKGVLDNKKEYQKEVKSDDIPNEKETVTVSQYAISDTKEAQSFSDFVMNNSEVEWSHTDIKGSNSIISTSHEYGAERGTSEVLTDANKSNKEIILFDHSHTNGTFNPSKDDKNTVKYIKQTSPNVKCGLFLPGYTKAFFIRVPYDENGIRTHDDKNFIERK
jgi:hypothetical protein